jgi:plasmid stability protein
MATLNVKNLPDSLYRKLKARARRERRSLSQQVTVLLTEALEATAPVSILDLRGLGKELWQEMDASEYVDGERREWR